MNRSAPLKRSGELKRTCTLRPGGGGLKRCALERRAPLARNGAGTSSSAQCPGSARQCDYQPRPREVARAVGVIDPGVRVRSLPKFAYVRDERLRFMCGAMPCQHCGREGPDAGVTWAHSNQGAHGKGKSIKASDIFVAALCLTCHFAVDQGSVLSHQDRIVLWERAHRRTVLLALKGGLWPPGVPLPLQVNERDLADFRVGEPPDGALLRQAHATAGKGSKGPTLRGRPAPVD